MWERRTRGEQTRLSSGRSLQQEVRRRYRQELSAKRKQKLVERGGDNATLIVALRFYIDALPAGQPRYAPFIEAKYRKLPRKIKQHLKLARRVLGIRFEPSRNIYVMPRFFRHRLLNIGLDIFESSTQREQFLALSSNIQVDGPVTEFAAQNHHLLQNAFRVLGGWKRSLGARLEGGPVDTRPVLSEEPASSASPYSVQIRNQILSNKANRLEKIRPRG